MYIAPEYISMRRLTICRPEDNNIKYRQGRTCLRLHHVWCGKNGLVQTSNHLKSRLAARFLLLSTTITTPDRSTVMSSSSVVLIDRPTPMELQPDKVIVSYLKSIVAADPRAIRRKQEESPQKYRLLSQFDPEIIDVILKYAKGNEDDCQRTHCRRPVHMTDALRNFKACAICRAKRALNDNKVPDAVMATEGFTAPARSGPKTKKVRIQFIIG